MPVIVQKYGGTSVADPARIKAVADRVVRTRAEGNDVVVVVSAMGQTTDQLLDLAAQVSSTPHPREMDMLLTAGERISMALLAMALHDRGVPAVSYTGSQAGILTDSAHGGAQITRITAERVKDSLSEDKVVIVAGFQGVDPVSREVTTLGRGGSDTTAVALAATLGAVSCEILTDVSGVFTADPRQVPEARRIREIEYDQMFALATSGAGVLMPHSVEFARESAVPVHVRSAFTDEEGTWVRPGVELRPILGIAHRIEPERAVITIVGTEAHRFATDQIMALHEVDRTTALIDSDHASVSLLVKPERTEDALRFIHAKLFEMESSG
jgi:aspartate kinase